MPLKSFRKLSIVQYYGKLGSRAFRDDSYGVPYFVLLGFCCSVENVEGFAVE